MKKTLILLGTLAMSYTYAQQGRVGVNTESPQATLEVTPSKANALATATTNEGVIAPKLTKTRIANIATPVEGTLVYATDANYGGTNVAVSKITEKGYYFYNGTEWVKASAGNALSSNIYTADGTLTGKRTVNTGTQNLNIEGNNWFPLVVNSTVNPGATNNMRGGLAVHPNDIEKRVEFATTVDGDLRLWAGTDRFFLKRETGKIGMGTYNPETLLNIVGGGDISSSSTDKGALMLGAATSTNIIMDDNEIMARNNGEASVLALQGDGGDLTIGANVTDVSKKHIFTDGKLGVGLMRPKATLDVNGGVRALQGLPAGDASNLGYAFGNDGDTGLFATPDAVNGNISTSLDLYVNNVSRVNINQQGAVKIANLSGTGDRLVVADANGTLKTGTSISNFATSNIYTANGTLSGHRTVNMAGRNLMFTGGGSIGIGTANPTSALTIEGNGEGSDDIAINTYNSTNANAFSLFSNRYRGTAAAKAAVQVGDHLGNLTFRGYNGTALVDGASIHTQVSEISGTSMKANLIIHASNNVGIGNNNPTQKLDVTGSIKSSALSGDGDKIVIANNDGTLTKGVSISNFATSNIYTANGTLTSDRAVEQNARWLDFNNGGIRIKGNAGVYHPLTIRTMHSGGNGGIQIEPNGVQDKRVEFNATPEGNIRLWAAGDRIFVNRETGNVGIGTSAPTEKLDVAGSIKSTALAGTGSRNVVADANGKLVIGETTVPIRTVTASTTLTAADNNGYVYVNVAGGVPTGVTSASGSLAAVATVTVPSNLPEGFSCIIVQQGTGTVGIVGNGVTLQTARGTKTRTQYSAVGIIKRTATEATITGDAIN